MSSSDKRIAAAFVLCFTTALGVGVTRAQDAATPLSAYVGRQVPTLAPLLRAVAPAVVNIAVRGRVRDDNPLYNDPFFRQFFDAPRQVERETEATGSGVIVDASRGLVLTNNHLLKNQTEVEVATSDNRRFRARVVGRETETDIALLQIPPDPALRELRFGDSSALQVGDFVIAIGNPFGLGQTVTMGIVSAIGRNNLGVGGRTSYIQTDASINPGNSGGALIDLQGRLVGINTAILTKGGNGVGIGFAIPSNAAYAAMAEIVQQPGTYKASN